MATQNDILTEQEALQALQHMRDDLLRVVWRAFIDLRTLYRREPILASDDARTKANIMSCRMIMDHAPQLLTQCRAIDANGTTHFQIANNVRIRFKKLSSEGMPSNYRTKQETLYQAQDLVTLSLNINSDTKWAMLAVGPVFDECNEDVIDVIISCFDPDNAGRILWNYSIYDQAIVDQVEASYTSPLNIQTQTAQPFARPSLTRRVGVAPTPNVSPNPPKPKIVSAVPSKKVPGEQSKAVEFPEQTTTSTPKPNIDAANDDKV